MVRTILQYYQVPDINNAGIEYGMCNTTIPEPWYFETKGWWTDGGAPAPCLPVILRQHGNDEGLGPPEEVHRQQSMPLVITIQGF